MSKSVYSGMNEAQLYVELRVLTAHIYGLYYGMIVAMMVASCWLSSANHERWGVALFVLTCGVWVWIQRRPSPLMSHSGETK